MYGSTIDELNEITYDTRRCTDCYYTCDSCKICCDFHQLVRNYLSDKLYEFWWSYWETNNEYWNEKRKVSNAFPQFAVLLEYMRWMS